MNRTDNHILKCRCGSQRKRMPAELLRSGIVLLIVALVITACHVKEKRYNEQVLPAEIMTSEQAEEFAVEAPPLTEGIFPCSECHSELEPNPTRRELDWHEEVTSIFDHDKENRWCLDCHDLINRDSLRLASGKLLGFDESYKLCGQCHGEKLRDWRVGVHGKRIGQWNGQKHYLLCVHCHNPHAPKFEPMTPEPPPLPQKMSN
ncbi:hypothetical protein [Mangrovibacterium diazotrophicum]|uniref:Uncharacterized protein n=1 Tax=Mangrovibacterium diazotrophicum TaxID=1261403 RepID=A0A419VWZ9_9BACT|nr:hypothetical protein [Mangrovibacterium diazotrophicum]RKD87762.1 hypothetical protein BC643_3769 [Mangrovibacterium diazotrophicum]